MLRYLIHKEILDSILNYRFLSLAVFSIVLMPLSAFINYQYFEARRASFDTQIADFERQEGESAKLRAARPPVPLSSVARGTEAYMPLYYDFSYDGKTTQPGNIEAQDFTTLSTFGSFDCLFLVQVVFGLLAVLLTFDMVAGEKERGTLRAVLANRVPRDTVLLGKFVGGFLILWLAFLLGFLLLWLVLAAFDGRFLEGEHLVRMVFILGFSTLFLAAFFSLGLMVSTFCHTTRTSIVILLVVWVGLQLVIPKAGEMIAVVVVPVRSQAMIHIEQNKITEELEDELANDAGELYTRITGKTDLEGAFDILGASTPAADQFQEGYQALKADMEREQRDRVKAVNDQFQREKARQRRVSRAIALLSPAPALAFLVTDTAGTGDLAFQGYRDAVRTHHQILDGAIYSKRKASRYAVRIGGSMISSSFGRSESADLHSIPAFVAPEPPLPTVLRSNVWSLVSLLVYLIVPFLVAFLAFMRYDVR